MALDDFSFADAARQPLIARESQALSPSRQRLAHLQHSLAQLRLEAAPLNEQLVRCDVATQRHDEAVRHRDLLLEQHERAVAEAIARGTPLPGAPDALTQAEIDLRAASIAESAVVKVRGRLQDALTAIHERMGALQAETETAIATTVVDAAISFARQELTPAFRWLNQVSAVIDGVEGALVEEARQRLQVNGGQVPAAHRAIERLVAELRHLRTALASDTAPNLGPARRLLASLQSDPTAELEAP